MIRLGLLFLFKTSRLVLLLMLMAVGVVIDNTPEIKAKPNGSQELEVKKFENLIAVYRHDSNRVTLVFPVKESLKKEVAYEDVWGGPVRIFTDVSPGEPMWAEIHTWWSLPARQDREIYIHVTPDKVPVTN